MIQWALKYKYDCSCWSSTKRCKGFSKINDTVKYELQKGVISYTHVIISPIANDYITINFDYLITGVNTELRQKVFLQMYVRELHIDMQKNMLLGFTWHTMIMEMSVLVILL